MTDAIFDSPAIRTRMMRKCWGLAHNLSLTDDDRHDLARMIHGVDPDSSGSWRLLDARQLRDLSLMLEGFLLVSFVLSHRHADWIPLPEVRDAHRSRDVPQV